MVDNGREDCLKNIQKGQERQKQIQNTRTNLTQEVFTSGKVVMLKNEGMLEN